MSVTNSTMLMDRGHAVVIGGGRGIGEAIARRMAATGWSVTVADRLEENARAVASSLSSSGLKAYAERVDITNSESLSQLMEKVRQHTGASGVTAAVNSVGVFDERRPVLKTDLASFRRVLEVNLLGAFLFSQAVEPLLAKNAALVHVGSINGERAGVDLGAYKVSKAGLHMLARCMALELARDERRIRVNVVAPGWVDTPGERMILKAEPGKQHPLDDPDNTQWIPLGRRTETAEIANTVAFLCSSEAGAITGQVLCVDCGIST